MSHRCTTLLNDLTRLKGQKTASAQTWAGESSKKLSQKTSRCIKIYAIGFVHPTHVPNQMRALVGLLLLSSAISVIASASPAQELGRCAPSEAVEIIDGALHKGQTLQQAMEAMIKAKVFDGSKACITFIRERSMGMRDSHPKAFQSLWMN